MKRWFPSFPAYPGNAQYKGAFPDVRVGIIVDEFSMAAWEPEFNLIAVTPAEWRQQLADGIDLLLVESAWNGNGGAWQYKLAGSSAPASELVELVEYCRNNKIPTVFWNKEDPPHFDDFKATAALFDHVFTSDANKMRDYENVVRDGATIATMTFAAQPKYHHPIRENRYLVEERDIAFAGMYFTQKYPERREQMDILLGGAARVARIYKATFDIFSRFAGSDERYQFPSAFAGHVRGSLPYPKMLTAYRNYKVFLNVNSVVDSPTMCARRIFEIAACGTPVVSTSSPAVEALFAPDEMPRVHSVDHAELVLRSLLNSPRMRQRVVHRAQRRIWDSYTYSDRAAAVLQAAGIEANSRDARKATVSVVCSTNRPHNLAHLISAVAGQRDVSTELVIVLHGVEAHPEDVRNQAIAVGLDSVQVLSAPASKTLGECLNMGIEAATGDVIAKFDDDDHYGDYYLHDQLAALYFSGADIVGKRSSYAYITGSDQLVLRNPGFEHRWTSFLAGPTLTGWKEIFTETPFQSRTNGEDTAFLDDLIAKGKRVYSADPYNFIQIRGTGQHTWAAEDHEILANATVETNGMNAAHVDC
ncbi:glycosyltransferase [Corynebacterium sp. 13CS0277]|nr:glycosyltransferase [Corynebacterium sp. 13CS0277]